MALDSYYGSKSLESTTKKDSLDSITKLYLDSRTLDSLIEDIKETIKKSEIAAKDGIQDIDQKWVRKNEGKDMIYAEPSKAPAEEEFQEMELDEDLQKMEKIRDYELINRNKNAKATVDRRNYINELENLYNSIGSAFKDEKPKEKIENEVVKQQVNDLKDKGQDLLNSLSDAIAAADEEEKKRKEEEKNQREELLVQIETIKTNIDKKGNYIQSELSNVYNNATIIAKSNELRQDLATIMSQNNIDLDDLQRQEAELDGLISRLSELKVEEDEVKTADEFQIKQQEMLNNNLAILQNNLTTKYGQYWFSKMNEQEKENYIQMYMAAHRTPKEEVEKMIEDSISKANEEIAATLAAQENVTTNQEVENAAPKTESVVQEPEEFKGENYEMNKFNGRLALKQLKSAYSKMNNASAKQLEEFGYLYNALKELDNVKPQNQEAEQQKFNQILDIKDRIDALERELGSARGR